MKIPAENRIFVGKSDRLLALLRDFPRKNTPMPNDTYYVSFPLEIDEFPAVDLTE
jgi:hypothetical protein